MRYLRRPSPALIIACIALFVAMGGVSYGFATGAVGTREIKNESLRGTDIRNGTLTTKDIRNNEIRGADIRNSTIGGRDVALDTLGGNDIKESTLGQVPDSSRLGGLDAASFVRKEAPGFTGIALNPGWAQTTDSAPAGYDVDANGYAHLQGRVAGGSGSPFTLPAGARPAAGVRFPVVTGTDAQAAVGVLVIGADGVATPHGTGATIGLDGLTFPAGG